MKSIQTPEFSSYEEEVDSGIILDTPDLMEDDGEWSRFETHKK